METRVDIKFSPNIRIDLEIDPEYEGGKTPPDQISEIFLHMILMNEDLDKFFFKHPETLRVQYYVDDLIVIDMKNPMEEVRAKQFPDEHKIFFKADLKKTLKELTERMSSFQSALADVDFAEAEYCVNLISCWAKEGEKSTETKEKAPLEEVIKHAEAEFMKVNNRSDVQADYRVHMKVDGTHVYLPQKFWKDFIKSFRDARETKT